MVIVLKGIFLNIVLTKPYNVWLKFGVKQNKVIKVIQFL